MLTSRRGIIGTQVNNVAWCMPETPVSRPPVGRSRVITNLSLNSRRFALLLAAATSVVPAFAADRPAARRPYTWRRYAGQRREPGNRGQPAGYAAKGPGRGAGNRTDGQGTHRSLVMAGTYYLGQSLVFAPEDSGAGAPITYQGGRREP